MRRLGSTPAERGSTTGCNCPDIFELDSGNFAVIGKEQKVGRHTMAAELDGSIGEGEAMVIIPRRVLLDAKADIPDE